MNNIIPTITITDTRTITRVYKKTTSNTSTPNPNPIFIQAISDDPPETFELQKHESTQRPFLSYLRKRSPRKGMDSGLYGAHSAQPRFFHVHWKIGLRRSSGKTERFFSLLWIKSSWRVLRQSSCSGKPFHLLKRNVWGRISMEWRIRPNPSEPRSTRHPCFCSSDIAASGRDARAVLSSDRAGGSSNASRGKMEAGSAGIA